MVKIDILISTKDMFDYNFYHNYRHFQGIVSFLLGVVMLILCVATYGPDCNMSYVLMTGFLGLFFTVITPVRIYFKSYQQVKLTPSFKKPITYEFNKDGLTISQEDLRTTIEFDEMLKACDTGKSIILYVTSMRAYILPKNQIGDKLSQIVDILKASSIKKVKL